MWKKGSVDGHEKERLDRLGVGFNVVLRGSGGGVGFREAGGAHVAAGTQTLSGALTVSPQGEFVKTGAGTLEIPMQSIENGAPYNITVADGKLLTESRTACVPGRNHVE